MEPLGYAAALPLPVATNSVRKGKNTAAKPHPGSVAVRLFLPQVARRTVLRRPVPMAKTIVSAKATNATASQQDVTNVLA